MNGTHTQCVLYMGESCAGLGEGNDRRLVVQVQVLHRILELVVFSLVILARTVFLFFSRTPIFLLRLLVLKIQLHIPFNHTFLQQIMNQSTHRIKYNSNNQTAARTRRDVFVIRQLLPRDLEPVATWAGVVEDAFGFVPGHVFNFDFVVV